MFDQTNKTAEQQEESSYEKPAIIYESVITTRAGSPILDEASGLDSERPVIDLFPED